MMPNKKHKNQSDLFINPDSLMLNPAEKIILKPESPAIKQKEIADLYQKLNQFVLQSLEEAKKNNKPLLIMVADEHSGTVGRYSFIIEFMLLKICEEIGIKNLLVEESPDGLVLLNKLPKPDLEDLKAPAFLHLRQLARKANFDIVATGKTFSTDNDQREDEMRDTLLAFGKSALFQLGGIHIERLAKALKNEYVIKAINPLPPAAQRLYAFDTKRDQKAFDFIFSKDVSSFVPKGNIITSKMSRLLAMIDKASYNSPILLNQSVSPSVTEAPSANTKTFPAIDSSAEKETDMHCPAPGLPWSVWLHLSFWAGSHLGICDRPLSDNNNKVSFPDRFSEKEFEKHQQQHAAEYKLSKMGFTFDEALLYLYGDEYQKSSEEKRESLKAFLVDVLNGDVEAQIGEALNKIALINNDQQRAAEMMKLYHQFQLQAFKRLRF